MFRASPSAGHPYPYSSVVPDRTRTPLGAVLLCVILFGVAGFLAYIVRQQKIALADAQSQREQAQTESAQAKAESSRMTATAADLRLQLDRAAAAPAPAPPVRPDAALETQLKTAQGRISDLQSQLNQAQADLQAQQSQAAKAPAAPDPQPELNAAQARISQLQSGLTRVRTDLQNRLDQADARADQLQQSLADSQKQAQSTQAQLTQAEALLAKFQAPAPLAHPLPVSAAFRKSGDQILVWVKNRSKASLALTVTAAGPGTNLSRTATLKAGKTLEVGRVGIGSTVSITGDGYDPFRLVVH